MAFIPGYNNDIFISYAHLDNQTVEEEEKGWVMQLQEHLELKLSQRVGKRVHIWRDDRKLDGAQFFTPVIQEAVNGSALFLSITSRGYLQSKWCLKERKIFHRKATNEKIGLTVDNRSRIINLLRYDIPREDWPEEFEERTGFPFFEGKRPGDRPTEPGEKLFKDQLLKLEVAIFRFFERFKAEVERTQVKLHEKIVQEEQDRIPLETVEASISATTERAFTIYVADVADSLHTSRNHVVNELQQSSNVVYNIPPPYDSVSHENYVVETLNRADISIHLFDNLAGREIDGKPGKTYPQKQLELALKVDKFSIVWLAEDLSLDETSSTTYKKFLYQLKDKARVRSKMELMQSSSERLAAELVEKVIHLKNSKKLHRTVLLDFHSKDREYGFSILRFLEDNGFYVCVGPDADDPMGNLKIYKERIQQVGNLIILFGHVSRQWVQGRLQTARKIAVLKNPDLKMAVYEAPTLKASVEGSLGRDMGVHLLGDRDTFRPDTVLPFLVTGKI